MMLFLFVSGLFPRIGLLLLEPLGEPKKRRYCSRLFIALIVSCFSSSGVFLGGGFSFIFLEEFLGEWVSKTEMD